MKKIIFILLMFLTFTSVKAMEVAIYAPVLDKCAIISDKAVLIPVRVVALNDGGLSSVINEYKLGMISNSDDYVIRIKNLNSKYVKQVSVDTLKDKDNNSNINYYLLEDVKVKKMDIIMTFNIEIDFKNDVPKSLNVLGSEIILGDKLLCENINGYKIEVIYQEKIVKEQNNKNIYYFIIGGILIISFFVFISIKRK